MATRDTATDRTLRARIAAHALHASVDSRAHTEPARRAFLETFEEKVDPYGELPAEERHRRAQHALKSHMSELARRSVRARREKAAGK